MTNVPGDLKHGKTWTARLWGMKSRWLNICLHFYVWFVVTSSDHRKSLKKILIIFLLHEINKSALIFIKHFCVRFQSRDKKLCLNEISHRICRDLKNQILPEERWTYFKKRFTCFVWINITSSRHRRYRYASNRLNKMNIV